jgi:diadenylate cyclase
MFDFGTIKDRIDTYTNGYSFWGFFRLGIDLALVVVFFYFLYKIIRKRAQGYRIFIVLIGILLTYILTFVFQLNVFFELLKYIAQWSFVALLIVYNQEIKHSLDYFFTPSKSNSLFANKQEKKEIITILCNTADFLSKRRVGALMTIEREDSLNVYIEKAIDIKATVTQELLTTIFYPGTACHDGAVIIRKNKIMCAGAYLPSTDKYDVPKSLGTRHRAAIGISEKSDALTIVVSEETGNISVTIDGIINLHLKIERLEEMLDRYLLNK